MGLNEIGFKKYSLGLTILSLLIFLISYLLSVFTHIGFFTWVNAAGTIGPIFLSGLIVYIYFQMGSTQEKQFEIQRIQAHLMKSQQKPRLRIELVGIRPGIEIAEELFDGFNPNKAGRVSDFYKSSTGFLFKINNSGTGPANDLKLNVEAHVYTHDNEGIFYPLSDYGYEFTSPELSRVDGGKLSLAQPLMGGEGPSIQSGEADTFYAFTGLADVNNISLIEKDIKNTAPIPLKEALYNLDDDSILLLIISIKYTYAGGSLDEEILYRIISPVREVSTLENIEDYGRPLPDFFKQLVDWERA